MAGDSQEPEFSAESTDWQTVEPEQALERLGALIDSSLDTNRLDELRRALTICDELAKRELSPAQGVVLDYFTANAWSGLRTLGRTQHDDAWEWQQEEFEKEILHLRRALLSPRLDSVPDARLCQIFTNLANALNQVGRFVEATEYWVRALHVEPAFGMALGNQGMGLTTYASYLYDDGHQLLFLRRARRSLRAVMQGAPIHPEALPTYVPGSTEANRSPCIRGGLGG